MSKIKKIFLYFLGMFLTYAFSKGISISFAASDTNNTIWAYGPPSTQSVVPLYGPSNFQDYSQQSTFLKICSVIFTPINILILILIALIIGAYIYYRKKKNVK